MDTKMTTKEYLNQYKGMIGKIERLRDRIAKVENVLKAVSLDGMPRGTGTGDPTKNTAINLTLLKEQYSIALIEAENLCAKITAEIERVPDEKYRTLLYSRYILFESWTKIAERLDTFRPGKEYEVKHVIQYMHRHALMEFEKVRR